MGPAELSFPVPAWTRPVPAPSWRRPFSRGQLVLRPVDPSTCPASVLCRRQRRRHLRPRCPEARRNRGYKGSAHSRCPSRGSVGSRGQRRAREGSGGLGVVSPKGPGPGPLSPLFRMGTATVFQTGAESGVAGKPLTVPCANSVPRGRKDRVSRACPVLTPSEAPQAAGAAPAGTPVTRRPGARHSWARGCSEDPGV